MRELHLNGYIDDDVWFGDEITPEGLHEVLYGSEDEFSDDVHIRLNSYGGSCNAATRIYDDIRAYPGNVRITVSGTAASAATVFAMAADQLEMTPGSLWMVHDPSVITCGNERDLTEAIGLLRACKESILNIYATRCKKARGELAAMMTATTWMDAKAAFTEGFIDGIAEDMPSAEPTKATVQARFGSRGGGGPGKGMARPTPQTAVPPEKGDDHTSTVLPEQAQRPEDQGETARRTPEQREQPGPSGTPVAQLEKRLGLLMPAKRNK